MIIVTLFAVVVGLLMGLLGGGGSILTVPILVYWLGFDAKQAIVTSLIIVCLTSAIAVLLYIHRKQVCWKTGFAFSVTGVIGAYFGGRVSAFIPDQILLMLFSAVMLIAAVAMLTNQRTSSETSLAVEVSCPDNLPLFSILFDGLMVGVITGLVGVGGGFMLVPALNYLVKIPIHSAIGTSLFIIVLQSIAALLGHVDQLKVDQDVVILFTAFTIIGSLLGGYLNQRIQPHWLKKGFGIFVLLIGLGMLVKDINPATISVLKTLYSAHQEFVLGIVTALSLYLVYRLRIWLYSRGL